MRAGAKIVHILKTHGFSLLLLLVILIGGGFRLYDIRWDGGIMAHPDERSTVAFFAPTIQWPSSLQEALDPHLSPLNPFWDRSSQTRRSYTYGHFPLYLLVLTGNGLHSAGLVAAALGAPPQAVETLIDANTVPGYLDLGRGLVGLFDIGTIILVFLIARKLYGRWAGLLAATLSAFTVTQIQLAHFFAVDPISATFTFLALYGAMLMAERDATWPAVLTGLAAGLAIASKFSALPILAAPVVATVMAGWKIRGQGRSYATLALRLIVSGGVAFAAFAVTSPYVLLDFQAFYTAVVREQGAMVNGQADFPFTRQYRNTLPYVYFIEQEIRWGMGYALGLVAFVGLAWVTLRGLVGRIRTGELILMSWVIPYFGITGLFLAKFMRYMIPLVPLFTVMGAGLLVAIWRRGRQPGFLGGISRILAPLLTGVTLVATMVWALAFVHGVYGSEHPWVQASKWIYTHIPDGSKLGLEHWDDNLPFGLPGEGQNMGAHRYQAVEFPMYEDDNKAKFELIKERVRQADYIILSSNRLYRTIPKLPQRYPMTTKYYQYLFDGQLGFEKIAEFTAYPRLGPFVFKDDAADESFTVYDHPKPMIFKKVRDLSDAEWAQLFDRSWEGAIQGYVGQPSLLSRLWTGGLSLPDLSHLFAGDGLSQPTKTLLLDQPVDTLPVVDDYRWNTVASNSTPLAVVFWWLVVVVVGWIGWPLTFATFRNLADRGHMFSKTLTLLLVAYLIWLPANFRLAQNRLSFILPMLGLIALLSLWMLWRYFDEIRLFWRRRWRLILVNEALFAGAYLIFVGIRLLNPDLWQPWLGGEKFMDFAFLNATLKSAYFPPYDPYFAGGYLNYYYYGQYAVGLWFKLTGIMPTVGFNLAIPTLFALTVGNAFCLGYNLLADNVRRAGSAVITALTASVFVTAIGNLDGFLQIWRRLGEISGSGFTSALPGLQASVRGFGGLLQIFQGHPLPPFNYWDPTRVIPYTINEFPFFSFLFADLHPHMINMPFSLLFIGLLLNLVRRPEPAHQQPPAAILPGPPITDPLPAAGLPPMGTADVDSPALAITDAGGGAPARQPVAGPVMTLVEASTPSGDAEPSPTRARKPSRRGWSMLGWVMLPLVLGALAVVNTWDFPTFWGLALLVFLFSSFWRHGRFNWLGSLVFGVVLAGISLGMYWPFFANYQAISVGLGLVDGATDFGNFLTIWGLFLFVLGSFLFFGLAASRSRSGPARLGGLLLRRVSVLPHLAELYRTAVRHATLGYRLTLFVVVILLFEAVGSAAAGYAVIALCFLLCIPAVLLLSRRDAPLTEQFTCLLGLAGLIVLLGVEIFYMKDFLGGGDWRRMNTVFKFYIQVWLLLGLAAAVLLPRLLDVVDSWRNSWAKWLWSIALVALLAASLVYPVLGTGARVEDRFPGARPPIGTLDGMAFMTVGSYTWPDDNNRIDLQYDYEAIRWLMDNVEGTPVIAEAALPYYREGGLRVSSMTGFPTLLGMHQNEQRYDWQVGQRDGLAREFYDTVLPERALEIIRELRIRYIYVGKLERTVYTPQGIQKFEQMATDRVLRVVFRNEEVTIYQVAPGVFP